jgi:amidohydrolase
VSTWTTPASADLVALYQDLHAHPELAFCEHRTAALAARHLREQGFEVIEGVGGTGVVGVLRNGDGPTVLLRADMDALPVAEETGLPYASTVRAPDHEGVVQPVMHACGHDVHVTCLIGACARLAAARDTWRGTILAVFQPAEELGGGAEAMIEWGLFERCGKPRVVLGQHVTPLPAGVIGLHPGVAFAAADGLLVTLHGRGGHGSQPEDTVDPVVLAAATVMRLQGVVSREMSWRDPAVVTVGSIHAGSVGNIIPERAELGISIRSFSPEARDRVMGAIARVIHAEAAASGVPLAPTIQELPAFPAVVNDPRACSLTMPGLQSAASLVVDPGTLAASEDVGMFATAAGVPCVYWLLGGADPTAFAGATTPDVMAAIAADRPVNHSPRYAPVPQPTLDVGVAALVAAARAWLPLSADAPTELEGL